MDKTCSRCGGKYGQATSWKSRRNAKWCRDCCRKYMREWMAAHPEKRRETVRRWQERHRDKNRENCRLYYHSLSPEKKADRARKGRDWRLRSEFGIGIEEYEAMLELQNGLCAICRRPPGRKPLAVDHNHKTGKVRELLCHFCNLHLVRFENLDGWPELATAYLKKYANS